MIVRVVNIRDFLASNQTHSAAKYKECIYVGRKNSTAHLDGHPLANPFKVEKKATYNERVECVNKYLAWLRAKPDRFALLASLQEQVEKSGLPLACWCCEYDGVYNEPGTPCHAVVLAKILMGKELV